MSFLIFYCMSSYGTLFNNQKKIACEIPSIAAMQPIVKEWAGKRSIVLSHLDKGVLVFDKELSQIAQKNGKLNYDRSNSLSQSKEKLKKAKDRYGNKATYLLVGQPNDVEAMKKFLVENKGIEIKQIKLDRFKGLK